MSTTNRKSLSFLDADTNRGIDTRIDRARGQDAFAPCFLRALSIRAADVVGPLPAARSTKCLFFSGSVDVVDVVDISALLFPERGTA